MDGLAAFALGVFTGLTIYWVIYRLYWRRWLKELERDRAYLQEKVRSVEGTNFGLERQLTTQKGELSGLRAKIDGLERENRRALERLEKGDADRQALAAHLETLRAELDGYQKVMMGPLPPVLSAPQHSNGKTHAPAAGMGIPVAVTGPAVVTASLSSPPVTHKNGNGRHIAPAGQILEPVIYIARPEMGGDRLDIIPGISAAVAKKLSRAGVDSFLALSLLTAERLKELVGRRAAKALDAEGVIRQAKKLAEERRSKTSAQ